jgi:isochorismate hydrolase
VIDRQHYFNAMSDPRFADAVKAIGRPKIILSGLTTDYCLVYPTLSLIALGYHVFIVVDASGSWTKQVDDAALSRMTQMGATLTNLQSLAGELQNSRAVANPELADSGQGALISWFSEHSPIPGLMNMTITGRSQAPSA